MSRRYREPPRVVNKTCYRGVEPTVQYAGCTYVLTAARLDPKNPKAINAKYRRL